MSDNPDFRQGTEDKRCMNCRYFRSWFDIFYQEDPEEPMDNGECYVWYDAFPGDGELVCGQWRQYVAGESIDAQ